MQPTPAQREDFELLFRAHVHRVQAYVRRHVPPDLVDEIVAETFLAAWRHRDRVEHAEPMPWLLVTARHFVANSRRRGARGAVPCPDLDDVAATVPAVDGPVVERDVALAALASLTDSEREAVLLVAWDGLDNGAAAAVAGCSTRAFTVRLHRARLRLARELGPPDRPPGSARSATPARLSLTTTETP